VKAKDLRKISKDGRRGRAWVLFSLFALAATVALIASAVRPSSRDSSSPGIPSQSESPDIAANKNPPAKSYLAKACSIPPDWARLVDRGWDPRGNRDADLILVPKPPNFVGTFINTSHSGPYDFLQEVPLIFRGAGIREAGPITTEQEVTLAAVAPTVAQLMGFAFPLRDGGPITQILVPGATAPRLVVTVSVDGGGRNVLERFPDAWPNIGELMEDGVSIENAIVGSSPSITPAIHTSISTGAWPRRHGVTAIAIRSEGGIIVGAFSQATNYTGPIVDPSASLRLQTLGDLWDRANGNAPKVGMLASGNFPLGMLGHGASIAGGDKDIAGILQEGTGEWQSDPRYFALPDELNDDLDDLPARVDALDRQDGEADGKWLGHPLDETAMGNTPVAAGWVENAAETVIEKQQFGRDNLTDLLYLHFKSPDHVGHKWNMISPEMGEVINSVDDAIGDLVEWLDDRVGKDGYMLVLTADHGQTPLEAGGWAIDREELHADVQRRFDHVQNNEGVIARTSATSFFMNKKELKRNGITSEMVASFLSRYTIGENTSEGADVPTEFRNRSAERIFRAVFPGGKLPKIVACTGAG